MTKARLFIKLSIQKTTIVLVGVTCMLLAACGSTDSEVSTAEALARRIMGDKADAVCFERLQNDTIDVYELETVKGKVVIRGNNANSMAVGLNRYLQDYCLTQVNWYDYNPVILPEVMPEVPSKVRVKALVPQRFFLNYCTYGYTLAFWKWEQWEHFIDWMALNGINMPLAMNGEEAVYQKVYRELGMTDEQIRAYFSGPAHLPWHRMNNIDRWQGPLPQKWIDGQAELQKRILARERELNMHPVLPGFSGHIPSDLADALGVELESTPVQGWCGFDEKYGCTFLNPKDPHFAQIQKLFIDTQTEMYGTDHYYSIDCFNEVEPPTWTPETLAAISGGLYKTLADADKDAVWVQMGWFLQNEKWTPENMEAYLTAVPKGRLTMLDYEIDYRPFWKETNKFYGQNYIVCFIGNFGGATVIEGNFHHNDSVITEVYENGGQGLVGIGSTLEGFGVNEPFYEHWMSRAWDRQQSVESYIDNVADRHFGGVNEQFRAFWHYMDDSVRLPHHLVDVANPLKIRPTLEYNGNWTTDNHNGYSTENLEKAAEMLRGLEGGTTYSDFDYVDARRQVICNKSLPLLNRFAAAYKAKDRKEMVAAKDAFLALYDDLLPLLATHKEYSLEKWVEDARSWGDTDEEKAYYEMNAKTIITEWGDSPTLCDYAARDYDGLVTGFYRPRWEMFFDALIKAFDEGRTIDEINDALYEFEKGFAGIN